MAGPKGSKYYDIFLDYKVCLKSKSNTEGFTDKFVSLLDAIDKTGSITTAAQQLGISYRKAWGDIRQAEAFLKLDLIETRRGGQSGGETHLTENGMDLVNAFRELHHDFNEAIYRVTRKFFHKLNHLPADDI